MPNVITPRKLSRLERIESLPTEMRDNALLEWATVTDLWAGKDVENTRKIFKAKAQELGEKLVRLSARRELPTWRTYCKVTASLAR